MLATVGYVAFNLLICGLNELLHACLARLLLFYSLGAFERLDLVCQKNRVYFVYISYIHCLLA